MAHCDAREGKWRGNWRMEWVASTLHTTSEHGVSSITTADAHSSAASSRLNWRPCLFKWTRPFRRKTKSGFCACAITFQLASTEKFRKVLLIRRSPLSCATIGETKIAFNLGLEGVCVCVCVCVCDEYCLTCDCNDLNMFQEQFWVFTKIYNKLLLTDCRYKRLLCSESCGKPPVSSLLPSSYNKTN